MKLYNLQDIQEIKDDLLKGDIIAFGTDTVFGLACVFDDLKAIKKIFKAKNRDTSKTLPMMCSNYEMIDKVAYINTRTKAIMKAFMPGAITIIYKKKAIVDDYVTGGLDTIGIRMPNDKWILNLIDLVGKPLLVTSANISGEDNLYKWIDVLNKLDGKIDGLVKKDSKGDKASTIIDCSKDKIKLLRQGPIGIDEILSVKGEENE